MIFDFSAFSARCGFLCEHFKENGNTLQCVLIMHKMYRLLKTRGESHQSCCPSNGQLGLTQSEVNYSHIIVSVRVCVCVCQYETGGVDAPGCPYVLNTHLINHSSFPQ